MSITDAIKDMEKHMGIDNFEELIDAVREGKQIIIDGREIVSVYDRRKTRNGYPLRV